MNRALNGLPKRLPASLVLLEQQAANDSPSLDFASWYNKDCDDYRIRFMNVIPITDNVEFWLRMSRDGGATYDASASYHYANYTWVGGGAGFGGVLPGGATKIDLTAARPLDNSVNWGYCGEFRLYSPGSSRFKIVNGQASWFRNSDNDHCCGMMQGAYMNVAAIRGLRFLMSSGNIASGIIRIYGLLR